VKKLNSSKIKNKRKDIGLYQYAVAKKMGVSSKTIQRIENGDKKPSEEEYIKLANIFQCDVLDLRQ
jgi:DNA-binding XRE family transcriptional regulator